MLGTRSYSYHEVVVTDSNRRSNSDLDSLPLWVPHGEVGEPRAGVPVPLHEPLEDAAQLRPSEAQREAREMLPTAKQLPVRHRGHAEALLPPEKSK